VTDIVYDKIFKGGLGVGKGLHIFVNDNGKQQRITVGELGGLWWRGRFVYVATVMDLYTREVLGVSVSLSHTAAFVAEALLQALQHSRPIIVHSDQGSEYTSALWYQLCVDHQIIPSMSEKGSPWQNGYQESFYANFKVDLGDAHRFETFGELLVGIYHAIHYYNHERIHIALKTSPQKFAAKIAKEKSLGYTRTKSYSSV
jgi:putative transposase